MRDCAFRLFLFQNPIATAIANRALYTDSKSNEPRRNCMQFTSYLDNGNLTVALTGEIDHHRAKHYIQAIASKIEAYTPAQCVLDFTEVTFVPYTFTCTRFLQLTRAEMDLIPAL